jgi:site-specific DNA-methyltransferase (adenine-specific)
MNTEAPPFRRVTGRNGATATLHLGNNTEVLKAIVGCHACVTDPPYGLKFMGKRWDYDVPTVAQWEAVRAVLLPGAYLLSAGGSRTYHRLTCGVEDAGFEIRDCIMHVFSTGFPKNKNLGNGVGSALKPAYEPWLLARNPFVGTLEKNYQTHGTGGLNIDASRVGTEQIITQHTAFLAYSGENSRPWHEGVKGVRTVHTGRWPANLIHDGSDEVLEVFPDAGNGWKRNYGEEDYKGRQYGGGIFGGGGYKGNSTYADSGSAARMFYCTKASKADRGNYTKSALPLFGVEEEIFTNEHVTVKPLALMRYLCKLVCPPGGTIIDQWMGSGSTGVAALQLGFNFIGIDKDPESYDTACERIEQEAGQSIVK